ncbi:MAG: DMT family transporter [Termitinemataceae bacterium]|nr:MAG: DMT family transporter [Termitinemataceae bacterium]
MDIFKKGCIFAIISSVSYGLIPLFAVPLRLENISFDAVLVYRFAFSSAVLALYFIIQKISIRVSLKQFFVLMMLGLIFSLSAEFFFLSYDYLTAGTVSTVFFIYPVFVAVIMGVFFKERLKAPQWMAIIISLAAIVVLNRSTEEFSINFKGLILVFLSTLNYSLFVIIINKSCVKNLSGTVMTFYSMGFCCVFFLAKCMLHGDDFAISGIQTWFEIALFALITTTTSCITLAIAIKCIGSTLTSIFGVLEPIVAVAVSVIFLHESLSINLIIAVILVAAAVMILCVAQKK